MSIRDNMIQQVLGNPGKYSIQQLQAAMQSGSLPAYVVVPIIQDKVQQQKQMQAAMQQQQPDQGTIAEQVMQEADQMGGVAQLPSNLPQEYAHGGIVAFADNEDQPVSVDMPSEDIGSGSDEERQPTWEEFFFGKKRPQRAYQEQLEARRLRNLEEQKRKPDVGVDSLVAAAPASAPVTNLSAAEMAVPGMGGYEAPVTVPRRTLSAEETQQVIDQMRAKGMRVGLDTYRDVQAGRIPPEISAAKPSAAAPTAAKPTTTAKTTAAPGIGGFGGASISDLFAKLPKPSKDEETAGSLFEKQFGVGGAKYREKMEGIEAGRKKEAEALRGTIQGEPYEEFKANLMKEAEQRGIDKQDAKNMAIFKAGLAMMAGTSRSALQNIGAGAMVGAEDYQKAAAEIKKAEKEHNRMLAHIEEARRAEKRGDVERRISELDKATDRQRSMEEFLHSGAYAAGVKDIDARRSLFNKQLDVAGHLAVAHIQHEGKLEAALARIVGRDQVTPQLRMQAMKMVNEDNLGQAALKALDFKHIPKDKKSLDLYNQKVDELREKELRRIIGVAGGGVGAAPQPAGAPQMSIVGVRPQ